MIQTVRCTKAKTPILLLDTGGGMNSTVTSASWTILERTNQTAILKGYLDKDGIQCSVVNAMTVAKVPKRNIKVILVANNVTFIDDETELESLLQPFQAMRNGICFDMVPDVFGGKGSMTINDEEIPFEYTKANRTRHQHT